MNRLIEKLKKNEKPFGRLTMEEQEYLKAVGAENRQFYDCNGRWVGDFTTSIMKNYSLRIKPDYKEPEPEIVECEVKLDDDDDELYFRYRDEEWGLEEAVIFPEFIGYKYSNTGLSAFPRRYDTSETPTRIPTHVLFRNEAKK